MTRHARACRGHPRLCIFDEAKAWMAGHRRAEATPSFGWLCPAMTVDRSLPTIVGLILPRRDEGGAHRTNLLVVGCGSAGRCGGRGRIGRGFGGCAVRWRRRRGAPLGGGRRSLPLRALLHPFRALFGDDDIALLLSLGLVV